MFDPYVTLKLAQFHAQELERLARVERERAWLHEPVQQARQTARAALCCESICCAASV